MNERLEPVEDRLRRHHRESMWAWRLPSGRSEYENQVIRLALDALDGRREPANHPHALEEIGMCAICDADALVRLEESDRELLSDALEENRRAWRELGRAIRRALPDWLTSSARRAQTDREDQQ